MSDFFGFDPSGLINSIGGALGSLVPASPQAANFSPAGGAGGQFTPAPAVGGAGGWPTLTVPGQGLNPAQLNLGSFQPSGGGYGGFEPSQGGYAGFQPSGGIGGGFTPTPFNPLTYDPDAAAKAAAAAAAASGGRSGGTATYTGLPSDVGQWAGQTQSTFADLGDYVPDAMLAIIQHESSGKPTAYNAKGDAWGLFQQLHLNSNDPATQFAAARQLLLEKLATINGAYARLGLNPDARTRARDIFLAWAGQFDPKTAGPNTNVDIASGNDAQKFLAEIMPMYDNIVSGKRAGGPANSNALVQRAQTLLGTPYALGGLRAHPNAPQAGLDCSEYTAWIYQGQGVSLPWNAQQQYNQTARVSSPGDLAVGDLVFFQGTNSADPDTVTHVGMYIGNGQFINAQDGGVKVANLNDPYWQQHYYGAGRVTSLGGGQPAPTPTPKTGLF